MQNWIPEPFRGFLVAAAPVGAASLPNTAHATIDALGDMVFLAAVLAMYDTGDDYDNL